MRRRAAVILAGVALCVGGSAIHPFGRVKGSSAEPLLNGASIDGVSLERLRESCGNCHSEQAQWPWYSYVAPASWLVEKDVSEARAHMDLSRWSRYSGEERIMLLTAIGAVMRTDAMPPKRYRVLHPEAALSGAERQALYEWAQGARAVERAKVALPGR
jgi:hypothetical protein